MHKTTLAKIKFIKFTEDVVSMKDFSLNKIKANVKDFADSLIEIGQIANPSNPYAWVAEKMEDMSKWNKKDWEYIFKKELTFKDIRSAQTTFEQLAKQIKELANNYTYNEHLINKENKMNIKQLNEELEKYL